MKNPRSGLNEAQRQWDIARDGLAEMLQESVSKIQECVFFAVVASLCGGVCLG
jgi:hypothetical protein